MKKKNFLLSLLMLGIASLSASSVAEPTGPILVLQIKGIINPVVGNYVRSGMEEAEKRGASAVLIELDTPGGLLEATRDAVGAMINSPVPVLMHTAPRGARATSAGVFLMMAADVSAMAPQTHIGAAHPVNIDGKAPEKSKDGRGAVMEEKMVSDASAYIRGLAQAKGRNAAWAERAVRESVSLTAEEAVKEKVVDLLSDSRADFLAAAHGLTVNKGGKAVVLNLKGAVVENFTMTMVQKFLHLIAHPNVAYVLMMLGIYGLIYEFAVPGVGFGAAAGATALILAFFALQILPVNATGVALVGLGALLLVLEVLLPSFGLLTLGGLASLLIGSLILIDRRGLPMPGVSMPLIFSTVALSGLFAGVMVKSLAGLRGTTRKAGSDLLIGRSAEVTKDIAPEGQVFVDGQVWRATSADALRVGERAVVIGLQGATLIVKREVDAA